MAVLQINFNHSFGSSFVSRRKLTGLSMTNLNSYSPAIVRRSAAIQMMTTTDRRDNNIVINRKRAIFPPVDWIEDEALERAVRVVVQRLEAVVERIAEQQTEKLRLRERSAGQGEALLSSKESEIVEKLSREIARKFLEKPIRYLRNGEGNMEEKLKEMNFLVGVIEESFFKKEK